LFAAHTWRRVQARLSKSVVEQLSADLRREIPDQRGFSAQNLWFMRQLYLEYKDHPNPLQLVREIPWGQNIFFHRPLRCLVAIELKA
jgi:predicted nuclease of restriction endonuclease-like (RecB) superfamily